MKNTCINACCKTYSKSLCSKGCGFTLVELLVALALGVILLLGMVQMFGGMKNSYRFQEGMARVQENGRIAMELISRQARLAGFRRPVWDDPQQGFYPLTGGSVDGGAGANDTLELMYMDDLDCFGVANGAAIHPETNEAIAWYKRVTFTVDANDNLVWSCAYGATVAGVVAQITTETIATGVDSFQILYGVDTDLPTDFSLNNWVVASSITPQTTICIQSRYLCEIDPGSLIANMANGIPVSIQVGLLLRSPEIVTGIDTVAFTVLDEDVDAAEDSLYRQLFVTTINLRNLTL